MIKIYVRYRAEPKTCQWKSTLTLPMCHGCVYTGSFVFNYHALYLQPRLQHIEIPYRAFPGRVGRRIPSLESVALEQVITSVIQKKILMSKTARFTGKSRSRIS